ncbi:MAG: alpha/beta hydrolase [Kineosporiaceae bacterium]
MGLIGADVDELRRLARELSTGAQQLDAATQGLTAALFAAPWIGDGADRYRHDWTTTHRQRLAAATAALTQAASLLDREAGEHQDASAPGAGLGGGGIAAGPVTPAPAPPRRGTPADNADWWRSLSPAQQRQVIADHPEWVGNRDGVPAWARDEANRSRIEGERARLLAERDRLKEQLAGQRSRQWFGDLVGDAMTDDDEKLASVEDKLASLDAVDEVLGRGDRQLLVLDLDGKRAKAAVAVGDVDTAQNVAVFTPGLTTTVPSKLRGYDNDMDALVELAEQRSQAEGSDDRTAAVTWIGYEAPQWSETLDPRRSVISSHQAQVGGDALASFFTGINASRSDDVHLTALGHSYGSTTTGMALQHDGTGVDDAVFFGSPGLGTSDVDDLHLAPGHAFVIEARRDPVADLARFGGDPNLLPGVTHLSATAGTAPDGTQLKESTGHSDYLAGSSTSQYNMAAVVTGHPETGIGGVGLGLGDALRFELDPVGGVRPWVLP